MTEEEIEEAIRQRDIALKKPMSLGHKIVSIISLVTLGPLFLWTSALFFLYFGGMVLGIIVLALHALLWVLEQIINLMGWLFHFLLPI